MAMVSLWRPLIGRRARFFIVVAHDFWHLALS
jgi:hypothetical protein